jgi:hypothetical protein
MKWQGIDEANNCFQSEFFWDIAKNSVVTGRRD